MIPPGNTAACSNGGEHDDEAAQAVSLSRPVRRCRLSPGRRTAGRPLRAGRSRTHHRRVRRDGGRGGRTRGGARRRRLSGSNSIELPASVCKGQCVSRTVQVRWASNPAHLMTVRGSLNSLRTTPSVSVTGFLTAIGTVDVVRNLARPDIALRDYYGPRFRTESSSRRPSVSKSASETTSSFPSDRAVAAIMRSRGDMGVPDSRRRLCIRAASSATSSEKSTAATRPKFSRASMRSGSPAENTSPARTS